MAEEEKKPPAELEKPAGAAKPPKEELDIHVIPDEFYGAALKKKVKKELGAWFVKVILLN